MYDYASEPSSNFTTTMHMQLWTHALSRTTHVSALFTNLRVTHLLRPSHKQVPQLLHDGEGGGTAHPQRAPEGVDRVVEGAAAENGNSYVYM